MSKFLSSLALSGLLVCGAAAISSAQGSFDITQPSATVSSPTADNFDTPPGVPTTSGTPFNALLNPLSPVQSFLSNASVSFGLTTQTPSGTGTGTYTNAPANFTFDLTVPSNLQPGVHTTKTFEVEGLLNGNVTFDGTLGGGDAHFNPQTILVNGVATPTIVTTSPAGRISQEIVGLDFGVGTPVNVFFDNVDALTVPGAPTPLAVGGYIQTTPLVPEPGAMALMVGMGISGAAFLRARRRG